MAKFFDIEIRDARSVYYGLQDILGMGPWEAKCACLTFGIGQDVKIKDLDSETWQDMVDWLQVHGMVEKERRAHVRNSIQKAVHMKSYRGLRHSKGLPVRGQRTHTNASRKRAFKH